MKQLRRFGIFLLLVWTIAIAIVACQGNGDRAIAVGSKDFPEQFVLGEMYALVLENKGFTVERKLNLGGTPVAQASLQSGEIDLYPEYTGTALLTVLKQPVPQKPQQVYPIVAQQYREKFNLVWLDPAPMNNTQALVMTRAGSQQYDIKTISEMAARANQLTLVGPPEFEAREDGLPGLQKAYGNFQLKKFIPVDPGLRYQALTQGQADVAVAFGTDGEIAAFNLVVLKDDRGLFPPYQVAPVARQDVLDRHPGLKEALNALAPLLTDETMRQLNYEVTGKGREPADVAKAFLVQQGIVPEK